MNLIITLPSTNWKKSFPPSLLRTASQCIVFSIPLPRNHVAGIVLGIATAEWEANALQWGANLTNSKRFHINVMDSSVYHDCFIDHMNLIVNLPLLTENIVPPVPPLNCVSIYQFSIRSHKITSVGQGIARVEWDVNAAQWRANSPNYSKIVINIDNSILPS